MMSSLEHPEVPNKVFETRIEWVQPTPSHYERVAPVPLLEISLFEEDPKEDEALAFSLEQQPIPELDQGGGPR